MLCVDHGLFPLWDYHRQGSHLSPATFSKMWEPINAADNTWYHFSSCLYWHWYHCLQVLYSRYLNEWYLASADHDKQSLQDDFFNILTWSARWKIPFNIKKCHILQLGTRNLKYDYEMSGLKLKSIQCVKDLAVMTAPNLKFSQQCKEAADEANM